jgi:branched-subunit amino acid aminotransferase/4-amino-4-deoxychorismate lyase
MASATLIETVRVRNGVAPLWELHLQRLVASCRALGGWGGTTGCTGCW